MRRLVICIPTYNRSRIIGEVLDFELENLKENGVDVIVYDSSENQETEYICQLYRKKGFDNLFFKKIDSQIQSNHKIYTIWQDMEKSDYDYVWLIHDHRKCTKTAISHILAAIKKKRDFYILDTSGKDNASCTEISTMDAFLKEGASLLTLYGASVISRKTFLVGTDWKKLEQKYLKGKDINFSQLGFYYERASQIDVLKISLLEFPVNSFVYIPIKEQGGPGWHNDAIRIWTKCWAKTILRLPACYKGKIKTIRSIEKIHLSERKLIAYQKEGIFGLSSFLRYILWIRIISKKSLWLFFLIARGRSVQALKAYNKIFVKRVKRARKGNREVVIFGAGKFACLCAELLEYNQIEVDAFVVSSKEKAEDFMGHPVLPAAQYMGMKNNLIVIIAVSSDKSRKEIQGYLDTLNNRMDIMYFESW